MFRWIALIAAVVFVLALAGTILSSQKTAAPSEQPTAEKTENGDGAKKNEVTLFDRWFPDSTAIFNLFLMVFTGVLAFGGLYQLNFLNRAEQIAARNAKSAEIAANVARDTLIAGQRAWIRIDEVKLSEPLSFTSSGWGVRTAVSLKVTNVGNAPALLVKPHAWLFLMEMKPSPRIQPIDEQTRLCEKAKTEPFRELHAATIFPDQSLPKAGSNIGALSMVISVERKEIDAAIDGKPNATIPFVIAGCVDYSFPTDPNSHHQTRFLFTLTKLPPAIVIDGLIRGNPIRPEDGQIPVENLMLLDFIGGSWAD
jgi:hypothetical protein